MATLPLILGAAESIPNIWYGIQQNRKANQLASELERPEFDIPESQKRALGSAETQAQMTRLPGQSAIEGRLDQITANQLNSIERLGPGGPTSLNAAGQAYGQQMQKENELGVAAAENYNQNQNILRNQLDRMSEWEFKKWAWDKQLPYQNKAEAIAALREGSMRNFDNAFKDVFGMGAMASVIGSNNEPEWLKNLLGSGTDKSGTAESILSAPKAPAKDLTLSEAMKENAYPLMTELNLNEKPVWEKFTWGK